MSWWADITDRLDQWTRDPEMDDLVTSGARAMDEAYAASHPADDTNEDDDGDV